MDGTFSSRHYLRNYSPSVLSFIDALGASTSSQAVSRCLLGTLSWGLDLWAPRLANTLKIIYFIQRHFGLQLTPEARSTLEYTIFHPHTDPRYAPYLIDLLPPNSPATLEQLAVHQIRLMCQGRSVPRRHVIQDLPLLRILMDSLIGEL